MRQVMRSVNSVRPLLGQLGFSRQANRKAGEGSHHADRNAQFEHINAQVVAARKAGQPVISVDTKKKELAGNDRNGGTDYRPASSFTPRQKRSTKTLSRQAPFPSMLIAISLRMRTPVNAAPENCEP